MRTLIRRTFRKKRPAPVTGGTITHYPEPRTTRVVFPVAVDFRGYPYCGGVDLNEQTAHFKLCRTLGENA